MLERASPVDNINRTGYYARMWFQRGPDLTPSDLALARPSLAATMPIAHSTRKLRESHHSVARMFAQGVPWADVQAATGYSLGALQLLSTDPSFKDLVVFYETNASTARADLIARMESTAVDIVDEIRDRLDEKPDEFTVRDLTETLKVLADRSGYGPQSRTTNVNVNLDLGARLEAARRRAQSQTSSPVIEGTVA